MRGPRIFVVEVAVEERDGVFFAESDQLPELLLCDASFEGLWSQIPEAIVAAFHRRYGDDGIEVEEADFPPPTHHEARPERAGRTVKPWAVRAAVA